MIRVEKLGATCYGDALDRMRAHIAHRADGHREAADELWLTEHPPVFTLGFASRDEHVRDSVAPAASRGSTSATPATSR